jgi:solute carrier family 9 (sodium/hydrogen exchanger), member 6/7
VLTFSYLGMLIGLILRLTANDAVLRNASFNDQVFFNLLLPPIILGAGYELHQVGLVGKFTPLSH